MGYIDSASTWPVSGIALNAGLVIWCTEGIAKHAENADLSGALAELIADDPDRFGANCWTYG